MRVVYPALWDFLSVTACSQSRLSDWGGTRLNDNTNQRSWRKKYGIIVSVECLYTEDVAKWAQTSKGEGSFLCSQLIHTNTFFFLLLCVNYQLSKAYSQLLYYLPLSLFFFLEVWPSSFVNEDTTLSSSGHCVFSLPIMSVNGGLLQKWEEIRIGLSAFGVGMLMRWRWTGQKSTVCPGLFPRYLEERLIPFRPWDKRCEHETSLNLSRITDPSNWF